jgi:hypothetical protein
MNSCADMARTTCCALIENRYLLRPGLTGAVLRSAIATALYAMRPLPLALRRLTLTVLLRSRNARIPAATDRCAKDPAHARGPSNTVPIVTSRFDRDRCVERKACDHDARPRRRANQRACPRDPCRLAVRQRWAHEHGDGRRERWIVDACVERRCDEVARTRVLWCSRRNRAALSGTKAPSGDARIRNDCRRRGCKR